MVNLIQKSDLLLLIGNLCELGVKTKFVKCSSIRIVFFDQKKHF
jgi:hypothetical protein